jgi:SPP1 family predicted phage head-tail adaptor
MRAGTLDRRIIIQTCVATTKDASGGTTETWSDFGTFWAEKRDLTGREFLAAGQLNAEVTTRFRMQWRTGIDVKQRILLDGFTYQIVNVAEIGRRDGLEILARARSDVDVTA